MPRTRLDQLLVSRGLAPSRERARARILAGDVLVSGHPITKAGHAVDEAAEITLRQPDHPWVSRGGIKLSHALDAFGVDAAGVTALDIGASTGGFTDVLLQRGAAHVVALDVGHAQLDWKLRTDPRVTCLEGINARQLTADTLPPDRRRFGLIVIDVAFISLRHIFPVLPPLIGPRGRVIALVKPQFEAGRAEVGRGGIVRDPAVHQRVLDDTIAEAHRIGLGHRATTPSPIEGAEGNREFFILLTPGATASPASRS
jgi:23S rRNA (cytidine1920-2'-O)/16S rRNA (cytidine1409-2'-O)-methyltransferase